MKLFYSWDLVLYFDDLGFLSWVDLLDDWNVFFPLYLQSESVKYFLDNLDRIGQMVSQGDLLHFKCTSYFFPSFIF